MLRQQRIQLVQRIVIYYPCDRIIGLSVRPNRLVVLIGADAPWLKNMSEEFTGVANYDTRKHA
jgi:hypothetical protein